MVSSQYFFTLSWLLAFSMCLCFQVAADDTYNSGRIRGVKNMKRLLRTNPNHIPVVINENEGEAEGDTQQEKSTKYKDNQTDEGNEEEEEEEPNDEENLSVDPVEKTEDKSEKYKESTKASKWKPTMKTKTGKKTKACTTKGKEEDDEIDSTILGEPCGTGSSEISPGESTPDETFEPTYEPTFEPTYEPTSEKSLEPTTESSGVMPSEFQTDVDETNPTEPSSSNPSPSEPTSAPRPSSTDGADNEDSQPSAEQTNDNTQDNPDSTSIESSSPNMPPIVESSGDDETNPTEPFSSNPSPSEPTITPRPSSTDGIHYNDTRPPSAEEGGGMTQDNPIGSPTVSPSPNMPPSIESSDETCQMLPNGSFGVTTIQPLEVVFFFQVETTPLVTQQAVNEALLPLLERGLGGRLVAFLFDECRQAVSARGDSNIMCEAQGYSGFPQDRVLSGVSCIAGSKVDPSNGCFVVDAGASLYFYSKDDCLSAINETKAEIKNAFDSGLFFNDIDDRIVNVKYVDASDLNFTSVNPVQGASTDSVGRALPLYAWALIALAGVASLLAIGVVVKRRRRSQDDSESSHFPVPVDGIDIDCPPSISNNSWYDRGEPSDKSGQAGEPKENEALLLPQIESQENDALLLPQIESQDEDILFLSRTESKSQEGDMLVDNAELESNTELKSAGDSSPLDSKDDMASEARDGIPHQISIPDIEGTSGEDETDTDDNETVVADNTHQEGEI